MRSYPTYNALAIDLDLHFFNKISILSQAGERIENGSWFVVTDDGQCHLFDTDGNLDDINKITVLQEVLIRKDLKKIIIPDSVMSIGWCAFRYCDSLTSVTIGNSVTSIGSYAFSGCSGLASVTIPDSVTSIGHSAFSGCSGLASVTIPDSVTRIGDEAFYNCNSLISVVFQGKTLKQVKAMKNYPWGIKDESIIKVS